MAEKHSTRDAPTAEYVRSALDYDPETGIFLWRWREDVSKQVNAQRAGNVAGCVWHVRKEYSPYRIICLHGKHCPAHRLAWLIAYGEWPERAIDHIDGDGLNNRLANLRLATNSENLANARIRCDNKTGLKGVRLRLDTGKFEAAVRLRGKRLRRSDFLTAEEAAAWRTRKARELHGEFYSDGRVMPTGG